ncbi:hypothetical protein F4780DRAFT_61978 [Xylariomycetidae sp. FL0641]|nr:hypothetical protein F4780DRAFT_61978 [Xylariomycetidae sp. FL0641]
MDPSRLREIGDSTLNEIKQITTHIEAISEELDSFLPKAHCWRWQILAILALALNVTRNQEERIAGARSIDDEDAVAREYVKGLTFVGQAQDVLGACQSLLVRKLGGRVRRSPTASPASDDDDDDDEWEDLDIRPRGRTGQAPITPWTIARYEELHEILCRFPGLTLSEDLRIYARIRKKPRPPAADPWFKILLDLVFPPPTTERRLKPHRV